MKPVFADLVKELAAADAEFFGGLGAVAVAGQEGALDRAALDFGEQSAERHGVGRVAKRPRLPGRVDSSASRCSGNIVRPCAAMTARASVFSSCRTLPGQGRCRMASMASGDRESSRQPCDRSTRFRMWSARGSISSGRSRSGGITIRATFKR